MIAELKRVTIELDPESELAKVLAASGRKTVVLVSNGNRYVVSRAEEGQEQHDSEAEAFRAALRAATRIFTPEEAEQLKQDIYRWREEGTRPIDRP